MIKEIDLKVPNENIISILKDILARAEAGSIQDIAIAVINSECTTSNVFDGNYHPLLLIGELRLLERDIVDVCCDTRRKVDWDFIE